MTYEKLGILKDLIGRFGLTAGTRYNKDLGFKEIGPYEDIPREDAVFMELKLV